MDHELAPKAISDWNSLPEDVLPLVVRSLRACQEPESIGDEWDEKREEG